MLLPKGVLSGSSWNDPLCKMRDMGHGMAKHCCEKPSEFPLKCLEISCFLPAKMDSHLHQFSFLVLVENVILKITKGCCWFFFCFLSFCFVFWSPSIFLCYEVKIRNVKVLGKKNLFKFSEIFHLLTRVTYQQCKGLCLCSLHPICTEIHSPHS